LKGHGLAVPKSSEKKGFESVRENYPRVLSVHNIEGAAAFRLLNSAQKY
jgi:hypothetical protein